MNFFIICESSPHSANYNIAVRLAHELKKRHEVYMGYFPPSSVTMKTDGIDGELAWMDEKLEIEYGLIRNKQGQRIRFLIKHPVFFVAKLMDRGFLSSYSRYFIFLRKAEDYCREKEIDVVIGITEPYIAAKIVSRLRIKSKKYVIQLDPYAYNHSCGNKEGSVIRRRFNEELSVIKRIDRLFTTSLIKKDLINSEEFRNRSKDIIEIEFPMIDMDEKETKAYKKPIINKKEGGISFLHCGSLYNDIRNPLYLVKLFEMLPDNYYLYVAGKNSELIRKYDNAIRKRIIDMGCLSLDEAAQARVEADILISYNNLVENQVPSKLFECINEGKPFINLCQLHNCPTLQYIKGYDMAFTIFTDEIDRSITELKDFVERNKEKKIDRNRIIKEYRSCTVEYLADQIVNA